MNSVPLDPQRVAEAVDNDPALLAQIFESTLKVAELHRTTLRQALAAGDHQTLQRTAHTIKGSFGNFDAQAVVTAALALEKACRQRQPDVHTLVTALDQALAEVAAFIAADGWRSLLESSR